MFSKIFCEIKQIIPIIFYQKLLNETILIIDSKHLLFAMQILKKHITFQYAVLSCISGIDLLNVTYRFCISYDLLSLEFNNRLRVKIFFKNLEQITSIIKAYPNANWWEREVWDMFGIYFYEHSDLRRILTDYGFEGYPLLKDFPLSGFIELHYNETKKKVTITPISLAQEYRLFNFTMPW